MFVTETVNKYLMRNRVNSGVEGAVRELPQTPKDKNQFAMAAVYPGVIFRQGVLQSLFESGQYRNAVASGRRCTWARKLKRQPDATAYGTDSILIAFVISHSYQRNKNI